MARDRNRWRAGWTAAGAAAALGTATLTAPGAVASAAAWNTATALPGITALNHDFTALQPQSLSCASAVNCAIGGVYTDGTGHQQVFVASEKSGAWGAAKEVPGSATLNQGDANLWTVSCGAAGDCVAGGMYAGALRSEQSFLVTEKNGTWGKAAEVPGTAALNAGGTIAALRSVSCTSATTCSGGGAYTSSAGAELPYLITETGGTWGNAIPVAGLATLGTGSASIQQVSCVSAGNCVAGGSYFTSTGDEDAFVITQTGGTWGNAQAIPGLAALNHQQGPLESLSCGAVGNCAAAGSYTDAAGNIQAWVASEKSGTWGNAKEVPGTAALNTAGFAVADTVSCGAAGNCAAGGWYSGATTLTAFVVSEKSGVWGQAKQAPGIAALNTANNAQLSTVSCPSAGNCAAGGYYFASGVGQEEFVISETNGIWGQAQEVPGTAALNVNADGTTTTVSCPSAGNCGLDGTYGDSSADTQVFVDGQG